MQRRGLLLSFISVILGVFLISLVSAQYYGKFGLSSILNSIDPSTMFLGLLFVITFAFLNYALSRAFKDNKAIGGIIAFAFSIGIVYWINLYGWDFEGFFFNFFFFIPEDVLYTIVPLILLGLLIFSSIKFGLGKTLSIIGGFLFIMGFTDLVYEKGLIIIIGLAFIIIGGIIWKKFPKKPKLDALGRPLP